MRLNLHDFSGHPFQIQLSRALAARGHEVVHTFSTQYVTGHGRLQVEAGDPETLTIRGLTAAQPMVKYSPVGRMRFEMSYANAWRSDLADDPYDVVVACNLPLFALARMVPWFARRKQPWVLWHQDLHSLGVGAEALRRLPSAAAGLACGLAERVERNQVTSAAEVVAITDAMLDQYGRWGIQRSGISVIPNWAPLDDIVPGDRDADWSSDMRLPDAQFRFVYAGTLGRKHNPLLLLALLDEARARGLAAQLVVASEGDGADDLRAAAAGRDDVYFVGFQPMARFGDMLASADAVIALLEPDAARFSVPSKVHSYLASGRPVIALVPDGNPSAREVLDAGGFVASPDAAGARAAARWAADLAAEPGRVAELGWQSRAYAEKHFDVEPIADRFEDILSRSARVEAATSRLTAGSTR